MTIAELLTAQSAKALVNWELANRNDTYIQFGAGVKPNTAVAQLFNRRDRVIETKVLRFLDGVDPLEYFADLEQFDTTYEYNIFQQWAPPGRSPNDNYWHQVSWCQAPCLNSGACGGVCDHCVQFKDRKTKRVTTRRCHY